MHDALVELQNGGKYHEPISDIMVCETNGDVLDSGEALDKVLYVNPTDGIGIHAVSYQLDSVGYRHNGKMLGDHYPVSVTFQTNSRIHTGIDGIVDGESSNRQLYNLNGQRVDGSTRGIVIERNREKSQKRIIK